MKFFDYFTGKTRNAYDLMKKASIVKGIASVTAFSMVISSLAIAASASSTEVGVVKNALNNLSAYGVVADNMTTNVHFESNFAVNHLNLGSNFDVNNAMTHAAERKIRFSVSTEETIAYGEEVHYYYGVYSGDTRIMPVIDCVFTSGTTSVSATAAVPDEYKFADLTVFELEKNGDEYTKKTDVENLEGTEFSGMPYTECYVGEIDECRTEAFKKITVYTAMDGSGFSGQNGGEWFYNGNKIGYGSTFVFNAEKDMDSLFADIKDASAIFSGIEAGGQINVLNISGSVTKDSNDQEIVNAISALQGNDNILIINLTVDPNEKTTSVSLKQNFGLWNAELYSRVIWNVRGGDGTNSLILGESFGGIVLAYDMDVSNPSTICGAVYTNKSYTVAGGEIHAATFRLYDEFSDRHEDEPEETTPEETTTTPAETTTTPAETTTTPAETTTTPTETTTPVDETTTPVEEVTTPAVTTTTTATTTPSEDEEDTSYVATSSGADYTSSDALTFEIPDEESASDLLVIDDEEAPKDAIPNTGVANNIMVFSIIGGAALTVGVAAHVYGTFLKKKMTQEKK